jgi:hypothetical protein
MNTCRGSKSEYLVIGQDCLKALLEYEHVIGKLELDL